MSCRVVLKRMFSKLIWFILSGRVPKTNKIQKSISFPNHRRKSKQSRKMIMISVYRKLKSCILFRFRINIISGEI